MGFDLNKKEFRDKLHLRYDWSIPDEPAVCVCGDNFDTDHGMICKKAGFITMRHNELHDLEVELLNTVCKDIKIEGVLQDITGEVLNPGANKAADARLHIHARGFWETFRCEGLPRPIKKHTSTLAQSKYTRCMNKKRNVSTQPKSWKSKRELLLLYFSPQLAE